MRTSARIKVSLYIPCHNYGRYLPQAVDSVLGQIMTEWDLVIINDGSSDNTTEVADVYAGKYPEKIRVHHHDKAQGLLRFANVALEMVKGEYIMRLDADDFLDESALLVMFQYLDHNSVIVLVYPNYLYVDKDGHYLRMENRKKVGTEAKLLDLPAHGACTHGAQAYSEVRRGVFGGCPGAGWSRTVAEDHTLLQGRQCFDAPFPLSTAR